MKLVTYVFVSSVIIVAVFANIGGFTKAQPPEKPIKFDHYLHVVDMGVECADCHANVHGLQAGQRAMPDHDACGSCHSDEVDANCAFCHADPDNPVGTAPVPGLYDGFAHQSHKDITCDQCHGTLEVAGTSPVIMEMSHCQECHLTENGPMNCGDCHEGKSPLPADHTFASWAVDHGLEAATTPDDCYSCHIQEQCDECHQGHNITTKPHSPNWIFSHFTESATGEECMVCHETRETCTNCHRTMIPLPHGVGPDFANTITGGEHVDEAKSFLETCISCHDVGETDPICARCHN